VQANAEAEIASDIMETQKEAIAVQAQRSSRTALIEAIRKFHEAAQTQSVSWQPQLPLELAFLELLPDEPAPILMQPATTRSEPAVVEEVVETEAAAPVETTDKPAETVDLPAQPAGVDDATATSVIPDLSETKATAETVLKEKAVTDAAPLTLDMVKAQWRVMVAKAARENKNLPPLLAMCKPLDVEGNFIILGFDFPIFKEKFDKTESAAMVISEAFSEIFGTTYGVRSAVTSEYVVPVGHDEFQELADELGGVVRTDDND
jgi:hypothetical protein